MFFSVDEHIQKIEKFSRPVIGGISTTFNVSPEFVKKLYYSELAKDTIENGLILLIDPGEYQSTIERFSKNKFASYVLKIFPESFLRNKSDAKNKIRAFHPKITFLSFGDDVYISIGSANLTPRAYSDSTTNSNIETMLSLQVKRTDRENNSDKFFVAHEVLSLLERIYEINIVEGFSMTRPLFSKIMESVEWLKETPKMKQSERSAWLLDSLSTSILSGLCSVFRKQGIKRINAIHIISPYFNDDHNIKKLLDRLAEQNWLQDRLSIKIILDENSLLKPVNGLPTKNSLPIKDVSWISTNNKHSDTELDVSIYDVHSNEALDGMDKEKNSQLYKYFKTHSRLHSKTYLFETNKGKFILTGSANFTNPGFFNENEKNIEACLLFRLDGNESEYLFNPLYDSNRLKVLDPKAFLTRLKSVSKFEPQKSESRYDFSLMFKEIGEELGIFFKHDKIMFEKSNIVLLSFNGSKKIFEKEVECKRVGEGWFLAISLFDNLKFKTSSPIIQIRVDNPDHKLISEKLLLSRASIEILQEPKMSSEETSEKIDALIKKYRAYKDSETLFALFWRLKNLCERAKNKDYCALQKLIDYTHSEHEEIVASALEHVLFVLKYFESKIDGESIHLSVQREGLDDSETLSDEDINFYSNRRSIDEVMSEKYNIVFEIIDKLFSVDIPEESKNNAIDSLLMMQNLDPKSKLKILQNWKPNLNQLNKVMQFIAGILEDAEAANKDTAIYIINRLRQILNMEVFITPRNKGIEKCKFCSSDVRWVLITFDFACSDGEKQYLFIAICLNCGKAVVKNRLSDRRDFERTSWDEIGNYIYYPAADGKILDVPPVNLPSQILDTITKLENYGVISYRPTEYDDPKDKEKLTTSDVYKLIIQLRSIFLNFENIDRDGGIFDVKLP